jgi:hypothetical protein
VLPSTHVAAQRKNVLPDKICARNEVYTITFRHSHENEKQEHGAAIMRLQKEYNRLQDRIDAMNIDKLDGLIDGTFFE